MKTLRERIFTDSEFGHVSDTVLAKRYGVSRQYVQQTRKIVGVSASASTDRKVKARAIERLERDRRLLTESPTKLAERYGLSRTTVHLVRKANR